MQCLGSELLADLSVYSEAEGCKIRKVLYTTFTNFFSRQLTDTYFNSVASTTN